MTTRRAVWAGLLLFAFALCAPGAARAATITVNSTMDATPANDTQCTLREAITNANGDDQSGSTDCAAGSGADTINFTATGTIVLGSALPNISTSMTISGPGVSQLTVSGNTSVRVFNVTAASPNVVTFSTLTIADGVDTFNDPFGAGIKNGGTATVNVTNARLSGNNTASDGGSGGGISNNSTGTINVTNSTLDHNNATAHTGGGIYNDNAGTINVINSTFDTNSGGGGGGIASTVGTVNVTNSTFSGNSAPNSLGGGIFSSTGTLTVHGSTLSGNSAFRGGGISRGGSAATVGDSLIALNTATDTSSPNPDVSGAFTSQGYNLIGNRGSSTGFVNGTNNDQVGVADPKLDTTLKDNGGPTQTLALLPGSPAIDKGKNMATDASNNPINTDQRGFTRPVDDPSITNAAGGDGSDIGAFEVQIARASAGQVIISEFRTQGTNAKDEFIELYNTTAAPIDLAAFTVEVEGGSTLTINSGSIPARGHFLLANTATVSAAASASEHHTLLIIIPIPTGGYSLADYGGVGAAAPDFTYDTDQPANAGVRLKNNIGTIIDAAGFTSSAADFKEGTTGLAPATNNFGQYSFARNMVTIGTPRDTNDNASDFLLVSTDPATTGGILGAPGPENTTSPINRTTEIRASLFGACSASTAAPNRERVTAPYADTLTPSSPTGTIALPGGTLPGPGGIPFPGPTVITPASSYASGTLRIRRRFTNNTGQMVTRLRFRVVDITAGAGGTGIADVRAVTSADEAAVVNPCLGSGTSTKGLTVEQPPTQQFGGATNTTVSAGSVAVSPLAPGASIDLNFLLGVQTPGTFRYFVIVESLPAPDAAPVVPPASTSATNFNSTKGSAPSSQGKGSGAAKGRPIKGKQ
jgi:CSLREA domain-containing protein